MNKPTRGIIIGTGRVGTALARWWQARDAVQIVGVLRHGDSSLALARDLAAELVQWGEAWPGFDFVLIATADTQIQALATALSGREDIRAKVVFHCSGALGQEVLLPLLERGAYGASAHPLYSFAADLSADGLAGAYCALQGDPRALSVLEKIFGEIDGCCFHLQQKGKAAYHAAAVLASNAQFALAQAAVTLWEQAGIDPIIARRMYTSLATNTLTNIAALGPRLAITGPVCRADSATIQTHLRAIAEIDPAILPLYRQFSLHLLALVKGDLSAEQITALMRVLDSPQSQA